MSLTTAEPPSTASSEPDMANLFAIARCLTAADSWALIPRPYLLIGVVAFFASSCAARGPSPALIAEAGVANAALREGCYRCIEQALATFERLGAAPGAPSRWRRSAFEAAVLLAARAKELGLDGAPHLTRARVLAADSPASSFPALEYAVYLDAVEYVLGELSGFDPEVRQQRLRRPRPGVDAGAVAPVRRALSAAPPTDLLAAYLALAIDCEAVTRSEIDPAAIRARHGDAPIIRFKLASCGFETSYLTSLREADGRWVDTMFFEGRREMAAQPVADVVKAAGLFGAARAEFPTSLAITLALASAQNALGEYDAALVNYDAVLSIDHMHRDALLGRVMSLSFLNRHTEAVATATRMIELGTWHVGDAYYWRAWNRYHIYALESAWADVEEGTKLLLNTSVYTLAGFIAFARKELEIAIDRFDRAFALDKTNCEAVWTEGLVHVEKEAWAPAAPKFSTAMSCFTAAAAQARADIEAAQIANYGEGVKARRIAAAEKRLETSEHRKAQAAFNAAQCFVRLGQKSSALNHVDVAAEHVQLREKATTLRITIDRMPR